MSYTKCSEFSSEEPIVRDLDLMSGLKNSGSEDIWGQMVLSRNGESHMSFQLNLQYYKAMDKSMVERWYDTTDNVSPNYIFSVKRLEPGLLGFPLPGTGRARTSSTRLLSSRNGKSTRLCPSSSLPSCNGTILEVRFGLFDLLSYIFYILYLLYNCNLLVSVC